MAIIGKNGSGKSTILELLLRFYEPEEGEILCNGEKYKSAKIIRIPKPFFCCESEISVVFGGHCAEYRFGGESRQTKN